MNREQGEVLAELRAFTDSALMHEWHRKWARPLDIGGFSGSHHGRSLAKLAEMGLAERTFNGGYHRKNYAYRISQAGREALAEWELSRAR